MLSALAFMMRSPSLSTRNDFLFFPDLMEVSDADLEKLLQKYKVGKPLGCSAWKEAANTLMMKKEYRCAIKGYSKALEEGSADKDLLVVILSNRAQAYLSVKEWSLALMDADRALRMDASHEKSAFRKGRALAELGRYDEAAEVCSSFVASNAKSGDMAKFAEEWNKRALEKKEGKYDWENIVGKCAQKGEQELDIADFFSPHVEVSVEGVVAGRGLRCVHPMKRGDVVLVEKALCVCFPTAAINKRKAPGEMAVSMMVEKCREESKVRSKMLRLHVAPEVEGGGLVREEMGDEERRKQWQRRDVLERKKEESIRQQKEGGLVQVMEDDGEMERANEIKYKKDEESYIRNVVKSNGFAWWDATKCNAAQRPQDHGYGVWSTASMINHACAPNCLYGFLGDAIVVKCAKDIEEGTELTLSYIPPHDSYEERRQRLLRRGIVCKCELCHVQKYGAAPSSEKKDDSSTAIIPSNASSDEQQQQQQSSAPTLSHEDLLSSRMMCMRMLYDNRPVHTSLQYLGWCREADTMARDTGVTSSVARVVGAMSADKGRDFHRSLALWKEAYDFHIQSPLMESHWVEETNMCVQAIFAAVAAQLVPQAEEWTPRLDRALEKFFPKSLVERVGNHMIMAYKMTKIQEEQAARGPGLGQMLG